MQKRFAYHREEKEVTILSDFSLYTNNLYPIYIPNDGQALSKDLAMLTKLHKNM